MIRKCDHTGCNKAGTCRAPKSRDLKDYWWFCQEHAAEYNKNWNFYADMTPDEIEADWERQTFGAPLKDKDTANKDEADYVKFLNDFIMGRSAFDHVAPRARPNAGAAPDGNNARNWCKVPCVGKKIPPRYGWYGKRR
ncbi:MAG: hypothetical protein Q4E56_00515 [Pseudomonadota bacterium]|nr:hypothetical protein [Pseudomonadota bacterium]